MSAHDNEIDRLRALGPERVDALTQEVLADMDRWLRDLLSSTDPHKSRLLRHAVLVRSRLRHAPAPTDDPQLRLVPSDEPFPEPHAAEAKSRGRKALLTSRPKIEVKV